MAMYLMYDQFQRLAKDIDVLFTEVEKKGRTEILVSNIVGELMCSNRGHCGLRERVTAIWKGLTSRDIGFAPEGAKYKSDIEWLGDFEQVLLHLGYETRDEKHGAGNKCIARRKAND